jgi:5-bromo-4-chloroindolyl phosphate hydrolysis protein
MIGRMKQKELKKLSRSELLEMLLDRSKEVEHLRKRLEDAQVQIKTLEQELENSGRLNKAIDRLEQLVEHGQNGLE